MTFGIKKCATLVVKPINFRPEPNYTDPEFYLGMFSIPKVSCYTYLGIPFSDTLSLKPALALLHSKVNKSLYGCYPILSNVQLPIVLKRYILQSYVLSPVIYLSPLLGSNKRKPARLQSIINTGMYWCINSSKHNTALSLYALSHELNIPPLSAICAIMQLRCFTKWKKSSCIIKDLIKHIPTMSYYSWTKESRTLIRKFRKRNINIKKIKEIKEFYWNRDLLNNSYKANNYKSFCFNKTRKFLKLGLKYPQYNLGFKWIVRIRCGFKFNSTIAIRRNLVTNDCPKFCPCCGQGEQTFFHWIMECSCFSNARCFYLDCINDLFIIFANQIEKYSLNTSYTSIIECERFILRYIFIFLLGGIEKTCSELHIDDEERKRLTNLLLMDSVDSSVPYIVNLAQYLTLVIPFIRSSFQLLLDRYKINNQTNNQERRRRTDMA